ncbi:MAG: hypothetical protein WCG01_03870 [bacterium]
MKKILLKFIAIAIFMALVPMISGFCFQEILGSSLKINKAHAEQDDIVLSGNTDVCTSHSLGVTEANDLHQTHKNSILPCCFDSTHASFLSVYQIDEPIKVLPIFFSKLNLPFNNFFKNNNYQSPIISPSELTLIRAVILRI